MKTFETEKGNIPEGATHYCNENDETFFCWFKGVGSVNFEVMTNETSGRWVTGIPSYYANDSITEIQQTKEVEWVNGDACVYDGSEYTFVGMTPTFNDSSCIVFDVKNGIEHVCVTKLKKPETEAERKEREESVAAFELWGCMDSSYFKDWDIDTRAFYLEVVRKTNYKVKGE
ncbi:hypothetical protein VPHK46_0007 [Vibrio phage K46]